MLRVQFGRNVSQDPPGLEHAAHFTIPNLLTGLRILSLVPFVQAIRAGNDVLAMIIFCLAGASDFFDGYIARRFDQRSVLGRLMDPLADKLLTGTAFILLSMFKPEPPSLPVWLMVAVVARDLLILLGSLIVYVTARCTSFQPSIFGKANTAIEIAVIICFFLSLQLPWVTDLLTPSYGVLLVSIVVSGGHYLIQGIRMARHQQNDLASVRH